MLTRVSARAGRILRALMAPGAGLNRAINARVFAIYLPLLNMGVLKKCVKVPVLITTEQEIHMQIQFGVNYFN